MNAQTGVLAGAISYELDGNQYIAISVGGNQLGGLLRAELFTPAGIQPERQGGAASGETLHTAAAGSAGVHRYSRSCRSR